MELIGAGPRGNEDFVSLAQHSAALAHLGLAASITSGYSDPVDEVARIAQDAPWRSYTNRSGKRVTQRGNRPA